MAGNRKPNLDDTIASRVAPPRSRAYTGGFVGPHLQRRARRQVQGSKPV